MIEVRRLRSAPLVVLALALLAAPAASETARTEARVHVVSTGNTLGSIARRYGVTIAALREVNDLAPGAPIKLGQKLLIPAAGDGERGGRAGRVADDEIEGGRGGPLRDAAASARARTSGAGVRASPASFVRAPKRRGTVRLVHGVEAVRLELFDKRTRRLSPKALDGFSRMLRFFPSGAKHAIDPRLVTLVGMVSDHFGGRDLVVVSGFRPYSPHQYTPHSNHNAGRAMDFFVRGVPNEVVRDFCKTLRKAGVGYYPNSSFVHLDVRDESAFWIDYAGPGEPPRYHRPDAQLQADEGAGEVGTEGADTPADSPAGDPSEPEPGSDSPPEGSDSTQATTPVTP